MERGRTLAEELVGAFEALRSSWGMMGAFAMALTVIDVYLTGL